MDDFLFVARHPSELNGVGDNFTQAGIVINYAKICTIACFGYYVSQCRYSSRSCSDL